ncbi:MAG: terminase TerL endonuclease subunit [Gallionella sp.]|jgi:phage terminase large subunit-like protein
MAKTARITTRDPVSVYARQVVSGKIIAGQHVRDACARHLRDLEQAPSRGFFFDLEKVKRAIGFFHDELRLNGGEYEGIEYDLLPWQKFIVGSLFGWVDAEGYRRFGVGYVETGKGSGKSPLAAGIGLYGLVADGEARAEIYAAATKKDQAMVLFRDAIAMVDQSHGLKKRLVKSGIGANAWNLAYHAKGSFFRPISADDGQSGPRPHIALLDEIHEHRNNTVVEMLRAGTKSRRQALIFMITNSGTDKRSVCWDYHDYGSKVAAGQLVDDSFFSFICALDEGDDPFKNEKCWYKANPSLSVGLPGLKYLRKQVTQARGMPSKESIVRRLNFCQWVEAEAPWIGSDIWFGCNPEHEFDETLLYGRRCWGGLDLSSTQDLTAFAKLFEPIEADPVWRLKVTFWLPGDGLHDKADRDRVPYIAWRDAGHLIALPGKAINKMAVLHKIAEECSLYNIQKISYDRWRIEDLNILIQQEGTTLPPLIPFGQGFKDMAPAVDEFERKLLNRTIRHDGNPVMTWCAANAVVMTDPAGNRKVAKERATGRVDGVVAAIMATGASANSLEEAGIDNWLRS